MNNFKSIEAKLNQLDEYDTMAKDAGYKIEVLESKPPLIHNYYKDNELKVSVRVFQSV